MTTIHDASAEEITKVMAPKKQRGGARYWVRDKDRRCSITLGKEPAEENLQEGFREVTAEEQDAFRAETRAHFAHLLK